VGVVTAMVLANVMILMIFAVDHPGLGQALIRLITTVLAYPIIVALAARAFGLKRIAPGEVDQLGHAR
ncbi:MAG: rod shape-determining protein MreD, partial [Boseongicola sp.]